MKKTLLTILAIAFVISTVGFLMDGDAIEPSMLMRFVEFFLMTGILFMLIAVGYFSVRFIKRSFQNA